MFRQSGWLILGYVLLAFASGITPKLALTAEEAAMLRRGCSHPPLPPSGLNGVATTTANISWTWDPTDCAKTYTVKDAFLGDVVASGIPDPQTFYNDHSLNENTPYTRFVTASNDFGESGPSAESRRYTLVDLRDFTLVPGDHQIEVSCIPPPNSTADKTGCKIRRTNKTTGEVKVVQDFAPKYQFTDLNLDPEVEYCYTIQYRNGDAIETGESYPKCAKPKDNNQALEVSCSGTHEHSVCVGDGVITFQYTFSATDPNKAMVAYVTDNPQAFISFGPETRTTPVFADAQAGLFAKGGAGVFDIGTATVIQKTLGKLLRERQQKVEKYKKSFSKIFELEAKISKTVKDEEDELPKLYDNNKGLENWPKAQKKIGNVGEQIGNFKQDLSKEHGKLRGLRREIFQIDDRLEAAVAAGEMSSNEKCSIVKVDVKLPSTDPVYNSREVLVQRDEIGPSNPRPVLILDPLTDGDIQIGTDRKARFTLKGSVTDALADVLEEDTGDIKTVKIFINNQEVATVDTIKGGGDTSLLRPFAKKFKFQKEVEADVQDGQRVFVRVESAANLIGSAGADLLRFVPVFDYRVPSGPQLFNVVPVSIFAPAGGFSPNQMNSIGIHMGLDYLQGEEPLLTETSAGSGVYTGTVGEMGTVLLQIIGVSSVPGVSGRMIVLLSSTGMGVTSLPLSLDQVSAGDRQYWSGEAVNAPRQSLTVQQAFSDSTEMGPRTTAGTFNPFYVRVVDPRGPGVSGKFKGRSFNTKEKEDLFNEIYFDKVLVVTTKAPLTPVQNIMQDTPTSQLEYDACTKTVQSTRIRYREDGNETTGFVCLPAEVVEPLLHAEKGTIDPGVLSKNIDMLKTFAITCSAGTGTIKGVTADGRLADARSLAGKPILSIVGTLSKQALVALGDQLLVVDENVLEVKVADLVQDAEAVAVEQIQVFSKDPVGGELELTWADVILRGKDDATLLKNGLKIQVTVSNDNDAEQKKDGLKTLLSLARREAAVGAASPTVKGTDKAGSVKLSRKEQTRVFSADVGGKSVIESLLEKRGTAHKPFQFSSMDIVHGKTGNFKDSGNFRTFMLGTAKWLENGVAQKNDDDDVNPALFAETKTVGGKVVPWLVCPPTADYLKAAGVNYLQVVGGSQRVGNSTILTRMFRQIQVQADVFYYSGHGAHDGPSILVATITGGSAYLELPDFQLADHWGESLKTVIIAGCSLLDLDKTINPATTTTNVELASALKLNPGIHLKGTGPQLFLGYRWSAPGDIAGADKITQTFIGNLPAGIKPTDYVKWRTAFRDANLTTGPTLPLSMGWRSYASIDIPANKFYFLTDSGGADFYKGPAIVNGVNRFTESSIPIPP